MPRDPNKANNVHHKAIVVSVLKEHGALTPDEIAEISGINLLNIRPACTYLKDDGVIERTGQTRPTKNGGTAYVLQISGTGPVDEIGLIFGLPARERDLWDWD